MKTHFSFFILFALLGASAALISVVAPTTQYQQMAQATTTVEPNQQRVVWWVTHCGDATECDELRDSTSEMMGDFDGPAQKETMVFHYCPGCDPQQEQIDALNEATGATDARKGFEFFSLAEVTDTAHLDALRDNGFRIMSYDLEGVSPQAERDNPTAAFESARQAIASYNAANPNARIELMAAPSQAITTSHGASIAPKVTWYHIQSQVWQDDDTTCDAMRNYISGRVSALEAAKPALEGEISFQVTLTNNAASGKTFYQTAEDCIDAVINDDVDGVSFWWSDTQYSASPNQFEQLGTYIESNYS